MAPQTRKSRQPGKSSRSVAEERREVSYRQLKIVAGIRNDRGVAIAYQGGRKFLESEDEDVATAVSVLKKEIDELHADREASRSGGAPSPEEYADALVRINRFINPVQQSALFKHAGRPEARATFAELARQIGVEAGTVQRAYVRLGRYLGEILNFHPEADGLRKPLQPILVVAEPVGGEGEEQLWQLLPNLAAALEEAERAFATAGS